MSRKLKATYLAVVDALRILLGLPQDKRPSGTGGAIG